MFNRLRVYPYKMWSNGASLLCESLRESGTRALRVYRNGRYTPRSTDLILNWGSPRSPVWGDRVPRGNILNHWENVRIASNKLTALQNMWVADVSIPEFTVDIGEANEWINEDGDGRVICRSLLNSSSGNGITLCSSSDELIQVPLYVKYIKKQKEYRVHVFNGEVIDTQEKKKRRDRANDTINYQIRSHDNGWVFTRQGVAITNLIRTQAINAVSSMGLSFGAVDIIYNRHQDRAYVLEVNTAPGLEGSTVDKYVSKLRGLL